MALKMYRIFLLCWVCADENFFALSADVATNESNVSSESSSATVTTAPITNGNVTNAGNDSDCDSGEKKQTFFKELQRFFD